MHQVEEGEDQTGRHHGRHYDRVLSLLVLDLKIEINNNNNQIIMFHILESGSLLRKIHFSIIHNNVTTLI